MSVSIRQSAGRRYAALVAALLAAAALGACGGESSTEAAGGGDGDGPVTVRVGLAPVMDSAPIHLGMEKGFFADEGLKLELAPIESGAASIAALVAGSNQFGQAAYLSAIAAAAEGVPVKVVAGLNSGAAAPGKASVQVLVVGKDSEVQGVKDLAGKTVALNALQSGNEIATRASLEAQGVDPDAVKYIAVPWPNMPGALKRGEVDAVNAVEPFLTSLLDRGARQIDAPLVTLAGGGNFPNAGFLASDDYIAEHPDIVERFARAVHRSADYAQEHPDEIRAILPTFTEIAPEVAEAIRLSVFGAPLDMDLLELSIREAKETGVIAEAPSSADLVHDTARK